MGEPRVVQVGWQVMCCSPQFIYSIDTRREGRHCSLVHEYEERPLFAIVAPPVEDGDND